MSTLQRRVERLEHARGSDAPGPLLPVGQHGDMVRCLRCGGRVPQTWVGWILWAEETASRGEVADTCTCEPSPCCPFLPGEAKA